MQGIFAGFRVKRPALWGAAAALVIVAIVVGVLLIGRGRSGGGAGKVGSGTADGGGIPGKLDLAGRVLDRLGRPLGGARVTARVGEGIPVVATTDEQGRYRVRMTSAAPARVRVEAEGFVSDELGGVVPPQAGLELSLARRLALEGLVRERGQPAGEAEVTIAGASGVKTAKAGPDGAFSFGALAEGRYALRAVRGDQAAYLDGVNVAVGDAGAGVVTVDLAPATVLSGRVRERGGRAIAGGEVTLSEADGAPLPRSATADADGNFRFSGVLPGAYVVVARADGYYPSEPRPVRVGKTPQTVDVRLDSGAIVEGRVVDEQAQPVSGAEVAISGESADGGPIAITASSSSVPAAGGAQVELAGELGILRGPIPFPPPVPAQVDASPAPAKAFRTDEKGGFRLTGLPAGRLVVVATHADFARGASEPLHVVAGADVRVTVVLSRGVEVRGRIVDDHGAGVGGADVLGDGATLATSDGRGEYQIAHVARALTVTVRAPGFLPATRAIAPSERGPVDFTLRRAEGRLGGVVVDDRGAPVSAARVEIASPPMAPRWVTTDRSGGFRADMLGPGPYRVTVSHVDFAVASFDDVAPSDDARLQIAPGGGVDGEIRDARLGGVPGGARLELVPGGNGVGNGSGKGRPIAVMGGRFRADALPVGLVTLVAAAPGYVTTRREVEIVAGDRLHDVTVRDVRIEMERAGVVSGRVRDDHGDPVADASVAVGAGGLRGRTDRDGMFRVDGVPPGRARVVAEKDRAAGSEEVEVRAGDESRVELRVR